jgi:hypothetical protein
VPSVYSGQGNDDVTIFVSTNPDRTRTGTSTLTTDSGEAIPGVEIQWGQKTPWWEGYPAWLQFILRWFLFGWIWM